MTSAMQIAVGWEHLDQGSAEERACFATLGIAALGVWLTEGRDDLVNRLRRAPYLSAYHLAQWLAWNWWRLRWEPRAPTEDWNLAHNVASIGEGYIWPNISVFSDGERTAMVARPTGIREGTAFRYISDFGAVFPSLDFESAVDAFVGQVLERLDDCGVADTNLARLWSDVAAERADPESSRYRKLEALMGRQPDKLQQSDAEALFAAADRFGRNAIEEVAADQGHSRRSQIVLAPDLLSTAADTGFDAQPANMMRLADGAAPRSRRYDVAAWRLGADVAAALRVQERLASNAISDQRLAEFMAVSDSAIESHKASDLGMSFLLDEGDGTARIALRSKWKSGRRFELARLLGDRLMSDGDSLNPATRAYTYRQKAQRSFAAELLSPFDAVFHMLQGDYSLENQADVARHFGVSEITIRTQLVNHEILGREYLDSEILANAA